MADYCGTGILLNEQTAATAAAAHTRANVCNWITKTNISMRITFWILHVDLIVDYFVSESSGSKRSVGRVYVKLCSLRFDVAAVQDCSPFALSTVKAVV